MTSPSLLSFNKNMFGNLPTLNQITNLLDCMKKDESLSKKFDLESEAGYNSAWDGLKNIYNFNKAKVYLYSSERFKLNQHLANIGFKLK